MKNRRKLVVLLLTISIFVGAACGTALGIPMVAQAATVTETEDGLWKWTDGSKRDIYVKIENDSATLVRADLTKSADWTLQKETPKINGKAYKITKIGNGVDPVFGSSQFYPKVFKTEIATEIGANAFRGVSASSFTGAKVTTIGPDAFNGAKFSGGITLSVATEIGERAFAGVEAKTFTAKKVTLVKKEAFEGATFSGVMTIPAVTQIYERGFANLTVNELTSGFGKSLTKVGDYSFSEFRITVPKIEKGYSLNFMHLTSIGTAAFYLADFGNVVAAFPKSVLNGTLGANAFDNPGRVKPPTAAQIESEDYVWQTTAKHYARNIPIGNWEKTKDENKISIDKVTNFGKFLNITNFKYQGESSVFNKKICFWEWTGEKNKSAESIYQGYENNIGTANFDARDYWQEPDMNNDHVCVNRVRGQFTLPTNLDIDEMKFYIDSTGGSNAMMCDDGFAVFIYPTTRTMKNAAATDPNSYLNYFAGGKMLNSSYKVEDDDGNEKTVDRTWGSRIKKIFSTSPNAANFYVEPHVLWQLPGTGMATKGLQYAYKEGLKDPDFDGTFYFEIVNFNINSGYDSFNRLLLGVGTDTVPDSMLIVDPNGGVWGGQPTVQSFHGTPGSTFTEKSLDPSSVTPPVGKTFLRWEFTPLSDGGTFVDYTYTFGKGTGKLKAIYNDGPDKLTLTINPNGGTYKGSTSPRNEQGKTGDNIPIEKPKWTDGTREFDGWTLTGGGSPNPFGMATDYTFGTTSATLMANWKLKTVEEYTIKFDANGGTGSVPKNIVFKNRTSTKSDMASTKPTAPSSCSDKTLYGWGKDETWTAKRVIYTSPKVAPDGTKAAPTASWCFDDWLRAVGINPDNFSSNEVTLYAQWWTGDSGDKFTVTLEKDGFIESVDGDGDYKPGDKVEIFAEPKDNCKFVEWKDLTDASGITGDLTNPEFSFTMPSKNVTLKATGSGDSPDPNINIDTPGEGETVVGFHYFTIYYYGNGGSPSSPPDSIITEKQYRIEKPCPGSTTTSDSTSSDGKTRTVTVSCATCGASASWSGSPSDTPSINFSHNPKVEYEWRSTGTLSAYLKSSSIFSRTGFAVVPGWTRSATNWTTTLSNGQSISFTAEGMPNSDGNRTGSLSVYALWKDNANPRINSSGATYKHRTPKQDSSKTGGNLEPGFSGSEDSTYTYATYTSPDGTAYNTGSWTSKSVEVTVSATDESGLKFEWSTSPSGKGGQAMSSGTSSTSSSSTCTFSEEGSYYPVVTVRDWCDRSNGYTTGALSVPYHESKATLGQVKIDKTAPEADGAYAVGYDCERYSADRTALYSGEVEEIPSTQWTKENVTVKVHAKDSGSGLSSGTSVSTGSGSRTFDGTAYYWQITTNGNDKTYAANPSGVGKWTSSPELVVKENCEGFVYVRDAVGNTAKWPFKVTQIDKRKPIVYPRS